MKLIPLSQGKLAKVDDEDYEYLMQWKWTYIKKGGYAYRGEGGRIVRKFIRMHRLINNTPDGYDTDHINRDGLDNRRANLRTVNRTQNNYNSGLHKNNKSGYRGVIWCKTKKRWRAYIGGSKTRKPLGYYHNIKDAVKARQKAESEVIL